MAHIDNTSHDRLEKRLSDIDWNHYRNRRFHPSPANWSDEVIYFLMVDRFSDGHEDGYIGNDGAPASTGQTPPFDFERDAYRADPSRWAEAGGKWCGGNLRGLRSKLGYLKRLGVTTLWISPIFRQVPFEDSYHGYGIQNFLDVDPRFGTRQEFRELVDEAHAMGLHVILDAVFNHAGGVFAYDYDEDAITRGAKDWARWNGGEYPVRGFRNAFKEAVLPFGPVAPDSAAWPGDAIWPAELQSPSIFHRKGNIQNMEHFPEYVQGDFSLLRDFNLGEDGQDLMKEPRIDDSFVPAPALLALCDVYKFWIAFADLDGLRLDAVKHLEPGAVRFLTAVLREFAESLGKENFYFIGEVTGGRTLAMRMMELTGMDAVLGIEDTATSLERVPRGQATPAAYFDLFRKSELVEKSSHVWFGKRVVTMIDDHDKVGRPTARFCANGHYRSLPAAMAMNLLTLGIPGLYYGTEQAFDGAGHEDDRYLRECMFGGPFGSLRSTGRHFFNEAHPVFRLVAELCALRRHHLPLRRGRQFLRPISATGAQGTFGLPVKYPNLEMRSVIPWSRIFDNREMLVAINTDPEKARTVWVSIDASLHPEGSTLARIYGWPAADGGATALVRAYDASARAIQITVPAGGIVIYS